MATYTEAEVTAALEAIVAEAGAGFIYKVELRPGGYETVECNYYEFDKPSCIVGHLFDRLGADGSYLVEGFSIADMPNDFVEEYFTGRVISALDHAQETQDAGYTWGDALTAYKRELGA